MNFVYLSPHFPPSYYQFCYHLNQLGVNVLGLADEAYDRLRPELQRSLREYYRVGDMHVYEHLLKACGHFTHCYGKIDRIDSHNEYWLETEARLREDFNISGPKRREIKKMKHKSQMKQIFSKAGVDVARGEVVHSLGEALTFIETVGYPVVAKPDSGVGAANTFKIDTENELISFFKQKPPIDYLMEEFIFGRIYTFDGLTDKEGRLVFFTSHTYSQGIMETVNDDSLIYYYSLREIPSDLEEAGRKVAGAYKIKERFFHFEFFKRERDQEIVALEVNMRPPGGLTTDMFNYANDIDIYKEWANVITGNHFSKTYTRPFHCCYVSRKAYKVYAHSHDEILETFGERVVQHESISGIFSAALGNYGYLIRSADLDEIIEMAGFIQQVE
ncbi:MAG TPA: ATP-grasp domain-containing protein [Anaerolineales bacterium]|nr:ATP-grasp domain-containing protein [Anaerolineales bacterium]